MVAIFFFNLVLLKADPVQCTLLAVVEPTLWLVLVLAPAAIQSTQCGVSDPPLCSGLSRSHRPPSGFCDPRGVLAEMPDGPVVTTEFSATLESGAESQISTVPPCVLLSSVCS